MLVLRHRKFSLGGLPHEITSQVHAACVALPMLHACCQEIAAPIFKVLPDPLHAWGVLCRTSAGLPAESIPIQHAGQHQGIDNAWLVAGQSLSNLRPPLPFSHTGGWCLPASLARVCICVLYTRCAR